MENTQIKTSGESELMMKNSEIFAQITWTRQDIRQLLEDHDLDSTDEAVDRFLEGLDLRRFEEACIEDGWERLSWALPR